MTEPMASPTMWAAFVMSGLDMSQDDGDFRNLLAYLVPTYQEHLVDPTKQEDREALAKLVQVAVYLDDKSVVLPLLKKLSMQEESLADLIQTGVSSHLQSSDRACQLNAWTMLEGLWETLTVSPSQILPLALKGIEFGNRDLARQIIRFLPSIAKKDPAILSNNLINKLYAFNLGSIPKTEEERTQDMALTTKTLSKLVGLSPDLCTAESAERIARLLSMDEQGDWTSLLGTMAQDKQEIISQEIVDRMLDYPNAKTGEALAAIVKSHPQHLPTILSKIEEVYFRASPFAKDWALPDDCDESPELKSWAQSYRQGLDILFKVGLADKKNLQPVLLAHTKPLRAFLEDERLWLTSVREVGRETFSNMQFLISCLGYRERPINDLQDLLYDLVDAIGLSKTTCGTYGSHRPDKTGQKWDEFVSSVGFFNVNDMDSRANSALDYIANTYCKGGERYYDRASVPEGKAPEPKSQRPAKGFWTKVKRGLGFASGE